MSASATLYLGVNAQIALASVVSTNTVNIGTVAGNQTFTAVASGATPGSNTFNVGTTDVQTAANLVSAINSSTSTGVQTVITASQQSIGGVLQPVVLLVATSNPLILGSSSATITSNYTTTSGAPVACLVALTGGAGETVLSVYDTTSPSFTVTLALPQLVGAANPAAGTTYAGFQGVFGSGTGASISTSVSMTLAMSNSTNLSVSGVTMIIYPPPMVGGWGGNENT